ncbi:MAG: hypothetical protein R2695_21565 [Acidimicrobiales bacterium]
MLASTASLMAALQKMVSDDPSIPVLAAEWSRLPRRRQRPLGHREDGTVDAAQAVDVAFADLMRDPFGTVATIYESMGRELCRRPSRRCGHFWPTGIATSTGPTRYSFADTELDIGSVRARSQRYEDISTSPRSASSR